MSSDIHFPYKVSPRSALIDGGSYLGDFTDWLRKTYPNHVAHAFEPCRKFWKHILERFKFDALACPYDFALSDVNEMRQINVRDNSTSFYAESTETEEVKVRRLVDWLISFKIEAVGILKLNIEGEEGRVIRDLIETGHIKMVENLVVQWHHFPQIQEDVEFCKEYLSKNYDVGHACPYWEWYIRK
jgi:FkbM family methyltransferase